MENDIAEIKLHIHEIKTDLKYHIKRTDVLEAQLKPIYHAKIWFTYTIALLGIVVTLYTLRSLI